MDGDGLDDLLIGAGEYDNTYGRASIFLGSSLGSSSTAMREDDEADYLFITKDSHQYIGSTVTNAGDVNGDGTNDILIGGSEYVYLFIP